MHVPAYEIETPKGRRRAKLYHYWIDHEFLRHRWTNFNEFAPGAFRSNHPTRERFKAYAEMGIRTVMTLRGGHDRPHHLLEVEACRDFGLVFHCVPMSARHAPITANMLQAYKLFDEIERPFLIHCKSGADRTGLVAAMYLMEYENASIEVAKQQLSFRYAHVRRTATGILDFFLETYEARFRETGIGMREWVETEYDAHQVTVDFAAYQKALRPWQGWRKTLIDRA